MKVNPEAWDAAMKLRGFIASEFLKYHGPTDSAAGKTLVELARERGYSARDRPVLGSTIRRWMTGSAVPQWAAKTMVCFILDKGFIPETDSQLDALLAYLLVDTPNTDANEVTNLPILQHLSKDEVGLSLRRIWHAKLS